MVRYTLQPIGKKVNDVLREYNGFAVGDRIVYKGTKGIVCYSGLLFSKEGAFFGLCLARKEGKNDGSLEGTRYFKCPDGHGLFVRYKNDHLKKEGLDQPVVDETIVLDASVVRTDNEHVRRAIDELTSVLECSICFGHSSTVVFCVGCKRPGACQLCYQRMGDGPLRRCPRCRQEWSSPGSTISTRAFFPFLHDLSMAARALPPPLLPSGDDSQCSEQIGPASSLSTARSSSDVVVPDFPLF